jgi:hypothetical protein
LGSRRVDCKGGLISVKEAFSKYEYGLRVRRSSERSVEVVVVVKEEALEYRNDPFGRKRTNGNRNKDKAGRQEADRYRHRHRHTYPRHTRLDFGVSSISFNSSNTSSALSLLCLISINPPHSSINSSVTCAVTLLYHYHDPNSDDEPSATPGPTGPAAPLACDCFA